LLVDESGEILGLPEIGKNLPMFTRTLADIKKGPVPSQDGILGPLRYLAELLRVRNGFVVGELTSRILASGICPESTPHRHSRLYHPDTMPPL
jgi:hypothetical protein